MSSIGKKLIFGSVVRVRVRQVGVLVRVSFQEMKAGLCNVPICQGQPLTSQVLHSIWTQCNVDLLLHAEFEH